MLMSGTASCTGFRATCLPDRRGTPRCRHRRAMWRAPARAVAATTGSSAASTRWPSLWPSGTSRTPAEIRLAATACRIGVQRRLERDAVARRRDADRHRIGHWPSPGRRQPVERGARPGRAGRLDEGRALRRRFQMALLRGREGRRKLGHRPQRRVVARRPMTDGRERRTPRRRSRRPRPITTASQRRRLSASLMSPALDRPFDPARIGERADRIGRRQPRHQAVQRTACTATGSPHRALAPLSPLLRGEGGVRGIVRASYAP